MRFTIHENGSFDILGTHMSLLDCYPCSDGIPLRPKIVKMFENVISYILPAGEIRIKLSAEDNDRIAISCGAYGICPIHDFSPIGSAHVKGASQIYVQGFGMEGPSGFFPVDKCPHDSHGLTALINDNDNLLLYAEDHKKYGISFQARQRKSLLGETSVLTATINFEGTAGSQWEAPVLYIEEMADTEMALRHCAERIAFAMNARTCMPPAFFWSGWYYSYETMDETQLREIIAGIKKEDIPFKYLELDAGYTISLGDWLIPNHRWPEGLAGAAKLILDAGFEPGIWVAPFIVGDRSRLYRDHPDWVLRDLDGNPVIRLRCYTEPKIWGNPDCNYYVLDASHPEALDYIRRVFETLHSWGYSMFKTDFMLWSMYDTAKVRRHNPTMTSVEIMRSVLGTIRAAIGEESYLLGCIAPFMPFIGFADGMRIAGDCGAQWAEAYGPVNMLREIPCDNYFNHVFWQNDPDAMMLRDFDTQLDSEEVWSLTLLQAISGGAVSTSDPVHRLNSDRKWLLRFIRPHGRVTPSLPYLGKGRKELVLTHKLRYGNLLFVMNPTEEPVTVILRMSELFGDTCTWYRLCMYQCGELSSSNEDLLVETLPPHESRLIFVTEYRLEYVPDNLWNW